ncbi:MAG: hypothetical protein ACODAJ_13620 [Planctomycetota bacterium]
MRGKLLVAVMLVLAARWTAIAGAGAPEEEEAPPPKPNPIAQYFANRGKDFLDIFNLKVGIGDPYSLLAHARATRFAQVGFGRFVGTKVGFDGPCAGIFGEGRIEYGVSIFYWAEIGRKTNPEAITEEAVRRNWFFGQVEDLKATGSYAEYYDGNRPWHSVGGAFALPFLPAVEAELNPAEAVDFLVSWFGIPGFRVPPPFHKMDHDGARVPAQGSMRWHGQEAFEDYE